MNDRRRPSRVDALTYRRLLGSFATGVTVVTTTDPAGRPAGMTASAVSAVSLEPPLLLICVDHDATIHHILGSVERFALNVLAANQEPLSRQFADDFERRFADVPYERGAGGLPLLHGVVAHIICERRETVTAGDHTVFFGEVVDGESFDRPPLIHFRGGYRSPDTAL